MYICVNKKDMEKRLTVDLPEEVHTKLVKKQLELLIETHKKVSLSDIIKEIIIEALKK